MFSRPFFSLLVKSTKSFVSSLQSRCSFFLSHVHASLVLILLLTPLMTLPFANAHFNRNLPVLVLRKHVDDTHTFSDHSSKSDCRRSRLVPSAAIRHIPILPHKSFKSPFFPSQPFFMPYMFTSNFTKCIKNDNIPIPMFSRQIPVHAATSVADEGNENGDLPTPPAPWEEPIAPVRLTIRNTTVWRQQRINLNYSVTVSSGGTLIIEDSEIFIGPIQQGNPPVRILVKHNGTLVIKRSYLTARNKNLTYFDILLIEPLLNSTPFLPVNQYFLHVQRGARLVIDNSTIEWMGVITSELDELYYPVRLGIWTESGNVTVRNSRFYNNTASLVFYNTTGTHTAVIENNVFYHSYFRYWDYYHLWPPYAIGRGVFLVNSTVPVIIQNNTFYSIRTGISVVSSIHVLIFRNNFFNNYYSITTFNNRIRAGYSFIDLSNVTHWGDHVSWADWLEGLRLLTNNSVPTDIAIIQNNIMSNNSDLAMIPRLIGAINIMFSDQILAINNSIEHFSPFTGYSWGILLWDAQDVRVEGNFIRNASEGAIIIEEEVHNVTVYGNTFVQNSFAIGVSDFPELEKSWNNSGMIWYNTFGTDARNLNEDDVVGTYRVLKELQWNNGTHGNFWYQNLERLTDEDHNGIADRPYRFFDGEPDNVNDDLYDRFPLSTRPHYQLPPQIALEFTTLTFYSPTSNKPPLQKEHTFFRDVDIVLVTFLTVTLGAPTGIIALWLRRRYYRNKH